MQVIQETANLFRLTRFGMVNCFLVKQDDGFILVDTNLPGSAPGILLAAKNLGAPIRQIVLTHGHQDHVGSVDALTKALPGVDLIAGARESRLMRGDFSLDPSEHGKKLFGFTVVKSKPTRLLNDFDRVGPLTVIFSSGHTPGHLALLDERDSSLIAGDTLTTTVDLIVAGVFRVAFPFPYLFCWNATLAAESADKLRACNPNLLCVGHGASLRAPSQAMDGAIELAFKQHPEASSAIQP